MIVQIWGNDCPPYSCNFDGVPEEIVTAAHSGLGQFLPDFDVRQMTWNEKDLTNDKRTVYGGFR